MPFSFVRVDRAGNMSKRQSATGFHFSRAGGTCPLWNVYEAFAAPGRVHVQIGMGCRVCERLDCSQRAVPPLGRALTVDENTSTFVPYGASGSA